MKLPISQDEAVPQATHHTNATNFQIYVLWKVSFVRFLSLLFYYSITPQLYRGEGRGTLLEEIAEA